MDKTDTVFDVNYDDPNKLNILYQAVEIRRR